MAIGPHPVTIPIPIPIPESLIGYDLTGFEFITESFLIQLGPQISDLILKCFGLLEVRRRTVQSAFEFPGFGPDLISEVSGFVVEFVVKSIQFLGLREGFRVESIRIPNRWDS